jgi:hypothetical protein
MADALLLSCDFAHRFVYWQGASGRRYIHSVYAAGACPPLPGAVYVAVARGAGGERRPLAIGRFAAIEALNLACPSGGEGLDAADEVHVHLLAETDAECERILRDLARGLNLSPPRASPTPPAATAQLSLFPA